MGNLHPQVVEEFNSLKTEQSALQKAIHKVAASFQNSSSVLASTPDLVELEKSLLQEKDEMVALRARLICLEGKLSDCA